MKKNIKYLLSISVLLIAFSSCKQKDYALGDLVAPSNIVIKADVVGVDGTHPNGDGSGDVNFTVTADNALSYKIDYDVTDGINLVFLPKGTASQKYLTGQFPATATTFRVTAVVYGKGGTSSTITKDVTVVPSPKIVLDLTGTGTKTWGVNKDVVGHFGVGPWDPSCYTGCWWSAGINEKVACCNCFYTARFTFSKTPTGFSLTVATPDGAFTKTGALAGGLPGIPATGPEACYAYAGGTSTFTFGSATSGLVSTAANPTTGASINLDGVNTFIGYGAVLKQFEILEISPTSLHLRVQGTETGNSWNLKLKPI